MYIHDYLVKNNLNNTAASFCAEARMEAQAVPVDLQDGMLRE